MKTKKPAETLRDRASTARKRAQVKYPNLDPRYLVVVYKKGWCQIAYLTPHTEKHEIRPDGTIDATGGMKILEEATSWEELGV